MQNRSDATRLLAKLGFGDGGDTAIYRDDQLHVLLSQIVQRDGIQTVAFLQPAGDIGHAVSALAAQKGGQQAGGSDTVHIVVAEYSDFLARGHGKGHPSGRQVHICQRKGVGQVTVTV